MVVKKKEGGNGPAGCAVNIGDLWPTAFFKTSSLEVPSTGREGSKTPAKPWIGEIPHDLGGLIVTQIIIDLIPAGDQHIRLQRKGLVE